MNKKGFTLIELLAVIVILAIIALIATPAVLNIIEDSKRSAAEDSARVISKAAETHYVSNTTLQGKEVSTIDLTSDTLKYKGKKPSKGYVSFDNKGNAYLKMYINGYCVESNYDNTVESEKTEARDCAINTVSIPLDVNGGTTSSTAVDYEEGEALGTLPTPTKKGHTFIGWYDGNGNIVTEDTVAAKGLTLTAHWEANTYTVTFKSEGQVIETRSLAYGTAYGSLPVITKNGYTLEWQVNGITITSETILSTDSNHEVTANWIAGLIYSITKKEVYLDPTQPIENNTCTSATAGSATGTYSGCMRWYVFAEEKGVYKLLLDHNMVQGLTYYETEDEFEKVKNNTDSIYNWDEEIRQTVRMLEAVEVDAIADEYAKTAAGYGTANQLWDVANKDTKYYINNGITSGIGYGKEIPIGWLYDNTKSCSGFGCPVEQANDANGNRIDGYWLLSPYIPPTWSWAWIMHGYSDISSSGVTTISSVGMRPVIEVPKSAFTN